PRGDAPDPGRGRTGRVEAVRVSERFLDRFVEDLRGDLHHLGPAESSPRLRHEDGDRPEQRVVPLLDRGANPHGACQPPGFPRGVRRGPGHSVTLRSATFDVPCNILLVPNPPCVTAIPGFYLRRILAPCTHLVDFASIFGSTSCSWRGRLTGSQPTLNR